MTNVVANAFQERVPMIVITGCVDAKVAATYTHQVFDHRALLGPISKASFNVVDGAVDVIIDKALAIATDGQPGPVHIDLPIAVAASLQSGEGAILRGAISQSAPARGEQLDEARTALSIAKRPLIIAGTDAVNQNAGDEISKLVKEFSIPLITTYKAKGIVAEDNDMVLGGAGLSPKADAIMMPLVKKADVVILAGYDPIEMRAGWKNPWGEDTVVIDFSAVPNTHFMHQAQFNFVGDTGSGLLVLCESIDAGNYWQDGTLGKTKELLKAAFPTNEEWGPAAVIDTVRSTVPRDTVATADTGAHRILLSQMWKCSGPRTLLQSTALCTMGCALPLAIGHSVANGKKPVIAFTGDAGLEMVLGELATARDLEVPIIVIVFVDKSLALIELKQRNSGFDNLGVDFGGTDFVGVANAMGGFGVSVEDRGSLKAAVEDALTRKTYTLISCPIGEQAYDDRF